MTLSVRLDEETKKLLAKMAHSRHISRSELVRQAIHALAKEEAAAGTVRPYELVKDLIGSIHGLPPDLSTRNGDYVRELMVEQKRKGKF